MMFLSVTRLEQRPWWRVNLERVFTVYAVQILNKYDGEQWIHVYSNLEMLLKTSKFQ